MHVNKHSGRVRVPEVGMGGADGPTGMNPDARPVSLPFRTIETPGPRERESAMTGRPGESRFVLSPPFFYIAVRACERRQLSSSVYPCGPRTAESHWPAQAR